MRVTLACDTIGGALNVPASKSMAHRALICAALAEGESRITGLTRSRDIDVTQRALEQLGARFVPQADGALLVRGSGGVPQAAVQQTVLCGESGSTLRFLIPLFARTGAAVHFTGEGRLPQRPQEVYARLFAQRGLEFAHTPDGVRVCGALPVGEYTVEGGVSSQFISGLLFALPLAQGDSVLHITPPFESKSYVDLTLQALADFGVRAAWRDAHTLEIPGGQRYRPCSCAVEGDFSQAAFFAVLGAVRGGVAVGGLRADSLQGDKAVLDVLQRCGARFTAQPQGDGQTAYAFCAAPLIGTEIDLTDCPDLGPVLMVLGLFCKGETVLRGAGRLRIKESDRIAAMEQEICKLGGQISSTHDTVRVRGAQPLHGAKNLCAHNDHRVVMALSVAALAAGVCVGIDGAQAVQKSYPHFFEDIARLGAEVTRHETD